MLFPNGSGRAVSGLTTRDNAFILVRALTPRDALLRVCVKHGSAALVEAVLELSKNPDLEEALIVAARNGCVDVVHTLLGLPASARRAGRKALNTAAANGHHGVVALMLDRPDYLAAILANDARPDDARPGMYCSALNRAAKSGHVDVVRLLLGRYDCDYGWALYRAAESGHVGVVRLLLGRSDCDYSAARLVAAANGHGSVVSLLQGA